MKFIIGLVISFAVGVGCRYFDIPVGSPAVIPGALLVLAMTMGYSSTDTILNRGDKLAANSHLCGGPTGASVMAANAASSDSLPPSKSPARPNETHPYSKLDEAICDLNVLGTLFTVQKTLPLRRDGDSIIMNGSISTIKGFPAFGVYGASEAAVRSLPERGSWI
jgi:XapX domain-containing protein